MEIKDKKSLDKLRDKRVLLVGLGILGGGVATAKWLVKNGAKLTITDLKDEKYLSSSIKKLEREVKSEKRKVKYVLGCHKEEDFKNSDLIVLNPDVPVDSPFVKIAKEAGVPITNELNIFVENVKTKNIVAITGTRGKTTTVQWTAFLMDKILGRTFVVGNSPKQPFLGMIDKIKKNDYVVIEAPSYHLEIVNKSFKPKVSVITNIFRDHINRHKTKSNYAKIKMNIFKHQDKDDYLILNKQDKWTEKILKKKLKPKVILFPNKKVLPKLPKDFGEHNENNLTIAVLVLNILSSRHPCVGRGPVLAKYIKELPQPTFRQEKVLENKKMLVVNDSAATSPEATIAAVKRFSSTSLGTSNSSNLFLITGGTDKGLYYKELGEFLSKNISSKNLILLGGSATEKLKKNLKFKEVNEFETLEECIKEALRLRSGQAKTTLLFSPGAKSFEKFKNEFDRGEKFNKLVKKFLS